MISLFHKYPGGECPKGRGGNAPCGFSRPRNGSAAKRPRIFRFRTHQRTGWIALGPPVPPSLKRCLSAFGIRHKGWVLAMLACEGHAARGSGPASRPCVESRNHSETASAKAAPKNRRLTPRPAPRVGRPALGFTRFGSPAARVKVRSQYQGERAAPPLSFMRLVSSAERHGGRCPDPGSWPSP